jgi:hypothetical protein
LVILSVAVFAWGLQYKLSLYDTPSAPNLKVAKLIQGEQPNKRVDAVLQRTRHTCSQLHLERTVSAWIPPQIVRQYRPIEKPIVSPGTFTPAPQSVRPPPELS